MAESKSARWCFTVNNPGLWEPHWDDSQMLYMVFEHEVGESGTQHIQGYVCFKNRKSLGTAKSFISSTAHMEAARGNEQQNKEYCTKDAVKGAPVKEFGVFDPTRGIQGKRTDITAAVEQMRTEIKAGRKPDSVWISPEHCSTFVKYSAGLERVASLIRGSGDLTRDVHVTVLWGPTGTGKSHRVMTQLQDAYVCKAGKNCMDLYCGEKILVLDEFEDSQISAQELNRWLDKWRCQLEARYSNKFALWTSVYILSNTDPEHWFYLNSPQVKASVMRRLQEPVGRVYWVESQEQAVDLTWWTTPAASAASSSAAAPAPPGPAATPPLPGNDEAPPPLKRKRAENPIVIVD